MELPRGGFGRNWVGNQSCVATHIASPTSEAEIAELVGTATRQGKHVRCAGSGHSFTPVVATSGLLMSLQDYQGIVDVDEARKRVTVKAGTKLSAVTRHLKETGLSLVNQGGIDSQAIAGALATGTHGTGTTLSNLSSQVVAMRIVRADGLIMTVSDRQDLDLLHATQVNIGMFGVVSELTLQVTDAFWLHDRVWREDFDALMEQHDELAAKHRHFGFFWCPTSASRDLYCLPDTTKVSKSGKDYDVCEIKVMDLTDSRTFHEDEHEKIAYSSEVYAIHYVPNFHELEYAVPTQHGKDVLRRVRELVLTKHRDCIFTVEYRFTKGNPARVSPFHQQDSVTISCSGSPNGVDYWPFLKDVDDILRDYDARPHWSKLHFTNRDDVDRWFPKAEVFRALRRSVDPEGAFLNDHLRTLFS
ncbi:D-arabinono-1,4-lactone oxidase [Burkholderia multivorans]|uniref:D-arabinono-1,4-lactone oxidase n=1 Tax=Burkholderia multivorans TaxID=87883 RepID=UPI002018780F|nr:D-arabinono-1,4-lactone oxidase [Burkholderia multivorans]MCO1368625.1 FAD-binding protein [Burkholderia multivorans]MCO1380516.1 FAD-binding protein [Burkholderia multivorans]MDN8032420.1 D-arabinono-1,4-lactone oxidase [Burkholderia multivorans]UQP22055.1 FAD-binding protein [Burkholderia multivorans]UQP91497.1 FAD-binding protein [Burkholderia multivorans]